MSIIINWGALYDTLWACDKKLKVAQSFRTLHNEKAKSNLKLLTEYCMLNISCFSYF